jgi:putative DNA primase/helicase
MTSPRDRTPIRDRARNKWRDILPRLGIADSFLNGKHGPCPACGGKDRYRFDDRKGEGGFYCTQCGAGDGFALLMNVKGWDFPTAAREVEAIVGDAVESAPPRRMSPDRATSLLRQTWDHSRPLRRGDDVYRYFEGRGLPVPVSDDVRLHPSCPVSGVEGSKTLPAMVALVRGADGKGVTLHRTYLLNGAKAPIESPKRLMPGETPAGVAIRLSLHDGILGIAEGIETAARVHQRFGIPCWAAVTAGLMREFVWPPEIRELHVFGDNDENFVGQAAAFHLAQRARRGRTPVPVVKVEIPPVVGMDWDDHFKAERHAA